MAAKSVTAKAKASGTSASDALTPVMNIGIVGHVDHGKTTLTEALSGKWTDTHSEEIKRGITIRLGYADVTFYECPKCQGQERFGTAAKCIRCFSDCKPLRTISLVDAPGHETLMATVLSGAAMMDGALLLVAANEKCPQPQTREHLIVLDIVGIRNIVIVQNKIDLVTEEEALRNHKQIVEFVRGTVAENAPIVPVSAQQRINIDALVETLLQAMPVPARDPAKPPRMMVARSFDVNKPGTPVAGLQGGVLGGSITEGQLSVGDEIEIAPGLKVKNDYKAARTKITGLQKSGRALDRAGPGGLLGVRTSLDPSLTKSDTLGGNLVGRPGTLPPAVKNVTLTVHLLERVAGTETQETVEQLKQGDTLVMTAGISRTIGTVSSAAKGKVDLDIKVPACIEHGQKVTLSRQILGRWRLIGWGEAV